MFDRVRVCTQCFRVYKELENYYFKELRRNIPGATIVDTENEDGEETERLMNREVKNDGEDADPRMRVDRALNNIFVQVKKNMEKMSDMRSTSAGNAKSQKDMFKTVDSKNPQKHGGLVSLNGTIGDASKNSSMKKQMMDGGSSSMKLPPITNKKGMMSSESTHQMTRNGSKKGHLFGAKSIDLLKSL